MGNGINYQINNEENKIISQNNWLINIIDFIVLDIDEEYYKMLEKAIEFGMSVSEFWYGNINMFSIYSKAYINRLHKQAFVNGIYNDEALRTELNNMFIDTSKGQKQIFYPKEDIYNPFSKKPDINKNNSLKKENNYEERNIFHIKRLINSKRKEEK